LKIHSGIILGPKERERKPETMTTIGTQRIEFSPQRDILGRMINVKSLSPNWMCWMPWLADGEEVFPTPNKTIMRNRASRFHMAGLK
jgi:hypothetical protein